MTPFQKHRLQWESCTRCPLCETRKHVVLAKGSVPCDILFVGEAPGASENVLGRPFVGPAGHLLDVIITAALGPVDGFLRIAFTNIVACIPLGEEGKKTAEPSLESIKACAPRLSQFIILADPKLIVGVGALASKYITVPMLKGGERGFASITHPAAILHADVSQRSLAIKRCIAIISDAVASLV